VSLFVTGLPDAERIMNPSLYHLQYRNGGWLRPQRIYYSREQRPEWPKAALGAENDIHLTFFTRGLREGAKSYDEDTGLLVYYTHLLGNLPSAAVAFVPTETPMPTPTLAQQLQPTPTPFPSNNPIDKVVQPTTADTYAAETVLGGLVAAGVLCVLVVVGARLIRRR
jgi:hypothetical protein